jgi:hypothetical protein
MIWEVLCFFFLCLGAIILAARTVSSILYLEQLVLAFGGVEAVPSSRGSKEWSRAGGAGVRRVVFYADCRRCRCHPHRSRAESRDGLATGISLRPRFWPGGSDRALPPAATGGSIRILHVATLACLDAGSTAGIFLLAAGAMGMQNINIFERSVDSRTW